MKVLKKIKLNNLNKANLEDKELQHLLGGLCCGCGCHGSSSTVDNQNANAESGYGSIGGNVICWCWNGANWERTNTN